MYIDSHAHCHFNAYKDDMDEVIKRSLTKGVSFNLVGTQKETSAKAVEVAEKYQDVYAVIGLHPEHLFSDYHDQDETAVLSREDGFDYEFYKKLALHKKTVGIGECGIDLYRLPENMSREEVLNRQREVFLEEARLAKECLLPLVIHCRDAHDEMVEVLSSLDNPERGVVHCYTGDTFHAKKYVEIGYFIGYTGIITFPPQKKNPRVQEELLNSVWEVPLEKMLIETDCPYLSPVPYRGKRGEPWMIIETAKKIAEIKGIMPEKVLEITAENARSLFKKMI